MSTTASEVAAPPRTTHPLLERLIGELGFAELDVAGFDAAIARPGHLLLLFSEDPQRFRETLDLAVIVPELARAFPGRFAVGVLFPEAARVVAPRFGVRRWPALVLLSGGGYVGVIDGVRDWDDYCRDVARLLEAPTCRPPSIGVAVRGASEPDAPTCH